MSTPKTAFILSGGGAKGAFQVGVLTALETLGIKPDVYYGTSIGAINAAVSAFAGVDQLRTIWRNIRKRSNVLTFNPRCLLLRSSGIYSLKPIRKLLQGFEHKIPNIRTVVTTVSLRTGKLRYTSTEDPDFLRMVEGSAAIPGIIEPIDEWSDGGTREMTPLKKAIDDQCTRLFVILTQPLEADLRTVVQVGNWVDNSVRALDIILHEVFLNDIKICAEKNRDPNKKKIELHIIAPSKQMIDVLQFQQDKIKIAIEHGYVRTYTLFQAGI